MLFKWLCWPITDLWASSNFLFFSTCQTIYFYSIHVVSKIFPNFIRCFLGITVLASFWGLPISVALCSNCCCQLNSLGETGNHDSILYKGNKLTLSQWLNSLQNIFPFYILLSPELNLVRKKNCRNIFFFSFFSLFCLNRKQKILKKNVYIHKSIF